MDASLITVWASIAGLPLAIIALYLRSIREGYQTLGRAVDRLAREYTTKREWERELAQMRQRIEQLSETVTSLATRIRTDHSMLANLQRDRRMLMVLRQREADNAERTPSS